MVQNAITAAIHTLLDVMIPLILDPVGRSSCYSTCRSDNMFTYRYAFPATKRYDTGAQRHRSEVREFMCMQLRRGMLLNFCAAMSVLALCDVK